MWRDYLHLDFCSCLPPDSRITEQRHCQGNLRSLGRLQQLCGDADHRLAVFPACLPATVDDNDLLLLQNRLHHTTQGSFGLVLFSTACVGVSVSLSAQNLRNYGSEIDATWYEYDDDDDIYL